MLEPTEEHEPRAIGPGSEDDDAPVKLKTWTGFVRRTSPKHLDLSDAKPMVVHDAFATGAGLDLMYKLELNAALQSLTWNQ